MPRGVILAKWDDELGVGALLEAQFPPDNVFQISVEDLVTIYTFHSMGGLKTGFMMISREDLNVASYFFNLEDRVSSKYYLSLILTQNEKAREFQEILIKSAQKLIPLIETGNFNRIELQLAVIYTNILIRFIKKMILKEKTAQNTIFQKEQEIFDLMNKLEECNFKIHQLELLNKSYIDSKQRVLIEENVNLTKELKKKDLKVRELENYITQLKLTEKKLNKEVSDLRTRIIDLQTL
ncbi:MAG: hypothetical protein ACTSPY_02660 [Candidatus Helarchaeota archaeon]